MGPYRWRGRIRYVDTDASQRIHYTAMFRHFEAAEQDFLHHLGSPLSDPEYRDIGFPRVHVECDFTSEIVYDDPIDIDVAVERVGNSSYSLQFATAVKGRPAARGKITVVCMDRRTQRSCPLPERLANALRQHLVLS